MNERPPTRSDNKIARRNYIVFCGAATLLLFLIVVISAMLIG